MLSIIDGGLLSRSLNLPIDPRLQHLLRQRAANEAHFVVVQPGDRISDVEQALSFSPFHNPIDDSRFGDPDFVPFWEWIEDHGHCFEAVFIFDDSGFAHVLLVEQREGVPAELLELCRSV